VLEDEELQRSDPFVEHREGGGDGERHGEERHQRKQRGVSQAAGGLGDALFAKARHQREEELPGGAQLLHQSFYHTGSPCPASCSPPTCSATCAAPSPR